jgi:hypothetical protein
MRSVLLGTGLILVLADLLGWSVGLVASSQATGNAVSAVLVVTGALALWAALAPRTLRVAVRRARRR